MLAMILLAGSASASGVLIHSDEPEAEALKRATSAGATDLDAIELRTLQTRIPVGLQGARVLPCTEAPTGLSDVEAHLDEAEGALLFMESSAAEIALGLAAATMNCLAEPIDPGLGARIWYLRGMLAIAEGQEDDAETHFYRARIFVPDLAWDEDFAPDARPLFEQTASQLRAAAPAWLQVVPLPAPGTLRIDGGLVDAPEGRVPLSPGPHLIQLGAGQPITLSVDLTEGDAGTLVVPALLPADALGWAADPLRRPELSATFAATLARDREVWVVHDEGVWTVHAGRDNWTEHAAPASAPRVSQPRERSGKLASRVLIGVGGAALLSGGGYAALNMVDARSAWQTGSQATTWDAYLAAEADYTPAKRKMLLGDAVALGGAAALGIGLVMAW